MKKTLALLLTLSSPMLAQADTLGFRLGANVWNQNYSGSAQNGDSSVDLEQDLGFSDTNNNSYYISFEHPIPLLPNIALARTELDISANTITADGFDFDGYEFPASTAISSQLDLSHTDATLYYELLDNWISIDFGLTLRVFDEGLDIYGEATVDGITSNVAVSEAIDATLPLVYLAAKVELPLTGFYVSAKANGIKYSDDQLLDYSVNLGYESDFGLGVEIGYRAMDVEYEDNRNEKADISVDGAYAGVFYHF